MCIKPVNGYMADDKFFDNERDAINHRLSNIAKTLKENHNSIVDLLYLHGVEIGALTARSEFLLKSQESEPSETRSMMVSPHADPESNHYEYWQGGFATFGSTQLNPYDKDTPEHEAWNEGRTDASVGIAKPWEGCAASCNLRAVGGQDITQCSCGNWPKWGKKDG